MASELHKTEHISPLDACKFCTKLLEQGGKDNFLKLIYEQTISKAEEIYGSLLYDIKNEVEREILLGIDC